MSARFLHLVLLSIAALLVLPVCVQAQRKTVAVIPVDKTPFTQNLADTAEAALTNSFRLADRDLSLTVVRASGIKNITNLSLDEVKNIGAGIGCDYIILLRSENLRRSSFKKNVYYEAWLATFIINARSGELISWKHLSAEADGSADADKALSSEFEQYAKGFSAIGQAAAVSDSFTLDPSVYAISDDPDSSVRTPLPFKRFSPVSTDLAQHLRIEAVVDIQVAIDDKGYVFNTRIVRWAGFGLDEEVTRTVRRMNFRPTIVDGKAVASSFVLRYNFRLPDPEKK
jgi:TonB family protein